MAAGRHAQTRKRRRGWVILVVCAAAVAVAAGGFAVAAHYNKQAAATPSKPPPALAVASVTPTGTNVVAGSTISVHLSTALAPDSPLPTLSPPVASTTAAAPTTRITQPRGRLRAWACSPTVIAPQFYR